MRKEKNKFIIEHVICEYMILDLFYVYLEKDKFTVLIYLARALIVSTVFWYLKKKEIWYKEKKNIDWPNRWLNVIVSIATIGLMLYATINPNWSSFALAFYMIIAIVNGIVLYHKNFSIKQNI